MSEKEGQDHFSTLPYEILSRIFQICKQEKEEEDEEEVNRVSDLRLVCKKFHQVAWDRIYLIELKLCDDHLERIDDFEPVLSQRPYLTTLRLHMNNEEMGKILKQASTLCPNLKYLKIFSDHIFSSNPLAAIENMPLLTKLHMYIYEYDDDEMFQSIANSNVEDFFYGSDESNPQKNVVIGKVLKGLENKLTSFCLDCNIVDNNLLSLICQCKKLETLHLPNTWGVNLSMLSKLKNLRTLGLRECYSTESKLSQCLKGIVILEKLEIISRSTFCESDLEEVVESCPNLKFLNLYIGDLVSKDTVLKCTAPLKKLEEVKVKRWFEYINDYPWY